MIKVDFHIHTSCSDGILSPTEVIRRAQANSVEYLAITDHDTLSGISTAIDEAKNCNIKIIPGIELSTQHNDESVHVLGFFKDDNYKNKNLIKELEVVKNQRVIRAKKIIEKLKDNFNIHIDFEKILESSKDTIARPHIARAIIDAGYDFDFEYIFNNFIGKNCKAYVPTLKLTTIDGINILKRYNCVTILAHPKLISNTNIDEFLNMNLDGIEAIYHQNTPEETLYFLDFANKNNLLVTSGSDFHGNVSTDTRHGDIGSMKLPQPYLQKFLKALNIK